jgi:hypothetical protein
LTLAAARHDLEGFLRTHVRDVDGGERIIGNDIECRTGSRAHERALGEKGRQWTFETAQVQHFHGFCAIVIHNDLSSAVRHSEPWDCSTRSLAKPLI